MARRECAGTRKDGKPCTSTASEGSDYCWRHPAAGSDGSDGSHAPRAGVGAGVCDWDRAAWLAAYQESLRVSEACELIGIAKSTAYLERQRNEDFAEAWDDVRQHVIRPSLEDEAYRRAVHGVEKMIVSAGRHMGTERVFSDQLLVVLLKANLPEKYRERVDVAHSGEVASDVQVRVDLRLLSDEELDAYERINAKLHAA